MIRKQFNVLMVTLALILLGASVARCQVIYDSTVSPLPGNQPSVGAEAYALTNSATVLLSVGTSRKL